MQRRFRVSPKAVVAVLRSVANHPANAAQRARSLARVLRFQLRGRLLRRPTAVSYGEHSKVIARFDDGASRRAASSPLPDFAEMRTWQRHLGPGDLFVDVGASVGLYSIIAAEQGAELICLEPLPRAREQLVENLALNGYDAEVVPKAVADQPGTMNLGGVDAQRVHLSSDGDGITVDVDTLDSVIGERRVSGLKIDVEGAERRVLLGAHRLLTDQRVDLIQLEWNDMAQVNFGEDREPVAALLEAAGYEITRPDENGDLTVVTDTGPGADVFARPQNRAPEASR